MTKAHSLRSSARWPLDIWVSCLIRHSSFVIRHLPLVCVFLFATGCDLDLPGKPDPKDRPVPADQVLAFDALYNRNCAGCHGPEGKQGPAPPLNEPLFRAIVPATALEQVLNHGRPGTPMAPFTHANGGPLTAEQAQVLIYQIKGVPYRIIENHNEGRLKVAVEAQSQGVAPQWGPVGKAADSTPHYALPGTKGDEARGARVFARACSSCHGDAGQGVVHDGERRNKINDRAFLALVSDQALRRIIITGRPDLGMPDYSQKTERPDDFQPLTSGEIADLGALLSAWRNGAWRKGASTAAK
jgi:cytochrome c oxidase cbb3-type subunit 3